MCMQRRCETQHAPCAPAAPADACAPAGRPLIRPPRAPLAARPAPAPATPTGRRQTTSPLRAPDDSGASLRGAPRDPRAMWLPAAQAPRRVREAAERHAAWGLCFSIKCDQKSC